eukprot:g25172.t1
MAELQKHSKETNVNEHDGFKNIKEVLPIHWKAETPVEEKPSGEACVPVSLLLQNWMDLEMASLKFMNGKVISLPLHLIIIR